MACQLGCAPMYVREGVDVEEFSFPDVVGGVGKEADGSYWIKVDGNGYSILEQVIYYWHRVAIDKCGRRLYEAKFDTNIDDTLDIIPTVGGIAASRHKFPSVEGHAICHPALKEAPENRYGSISIEVSRQGVLIDGDKYGVVKKKLEKRLAERINSGVRKIKLVPGEGDLQLKVIVEDLFYTGGFARSNFGMLAGRAKLAAEIIITDSNTKKVLWPTESMTGSEENFSSDWYSTDSQIKALSFKVATILDALL